MNRKLLKIGTFNCQSLNKVEKMLHLKDRLNILKIDILFIQETHQDNVKDHDNLIEYLSDFNVITELTDYKSKGVGILIKKVFKF